MDDILRGTEKGQCMLRELQVEAKKKGTFPPTQVTIFNTYMYRLLIPHFQLLNIPCPRPENLTEETATNMGPLIGLFINAFFEVTNKEPIILEYDTDLNPLIDAFEQSAALGRNAFVKTCAAIADVPEGGVESSLESPNTLFGALNNKKMPSPVLEILNSNNASINRMKGGTRFNNMSTAEIDRIGSGYGFADGTGWNGKSRAQKIADLVAHEQGLSVAAAGPSSAAALGLHAVPRHRVSEAALRRRGDARSEEVNRLFEILDEANAVEIALGDLQKVLGPGGADPVLAKKIKDLFVGYHKSLLENAIKTSVIGGQIRANALETAIVDYISEEEKQVGSIGTVSGKPVKKISTYGKIRDPVSMPAAVLGIIALASAVGSVSLFMKITGAAPFVMRPVSLNYNFRVLPFNSPYKIIAARDGVVVTYKYDPSKMKLTISAQEQVDALLAERSSAAAPAALLNAPKPKQVGKVVRLEGQPQLTAPGITGKSPAEEAEELEAVNVNAENANVRRTATATPRPRAVPRVNSLADVGIAPSTPVPLPAPAAEEGYSWYNPVGWAVNGWEALEYGFKNFGGDDEYWSGKASPSVSATPTPTAPPKANNSRAVAVVGSTANARGVALATNVAAAEPAAPPPTVFYLGNDLVVTEMGITDLYDGALAVNDRSHWSVVTGGPETYNMEWNNITRRFTPFDGLADLKAGEVYNPFTLGPTNVAAIQQREVCYSPSTYFGGAGTLTGAFAGATAMGYVGGFRGLVLGLALPYIATIGAGVNQCGGVIVGNARNAAWNLTSTVMLLIGGLATGAIALFLSISAIGIQSKRTIKRGAATRKLDVYNEKIYNRLSELSDEVLKTELRNNLNIQISQLLNKAEAGEDLTAFFVQSGYFERKEIGPFLERIDAINAEIASIPASNARKLLAKRKERKEIIGQFMFTAFLPVFIQKWYEELQMELTRRFGRIADPILILAKVVADKTLADQTMLDYADELQKNLKKKVLERRTTVYAESSEIVEAIGQFKMFGGNTISNALAATVPRTAVDNGPAAAGGGGGGASFVSSDGHGGSAVPNAGRACLPPPSSLGSTVPPPKRKVAARRLGNSSAAPRGANAAALAASASTGNNGAAALAGMGAASASSGNGNGGPAAEGGRRRRQTRKKTIKKRKHTRKH